MLGTFIEIVLPVFLMAGMGIILRKMRQVPTGPVSQVTLYVFSPCLVFHSLSNTALSSGDLGSIAGFTIILAVLTYPLAYIVARMLKLDRETQSGFMLTTLFMNSGNYGLPMALFAFGQAGLDRAIVFFVTQATLAGTLAVFVASRSQLDIKGALTAVFKMPLVYASLAGVAANLLNLETPQTIAEPVRILGAAAVPSMLMVLGLQIGEKLSLEQTGALIATCFMRLVVSAGAAYLLTLPFGFTGLTQQVLIIMASMPAAVVNIILATEFKAKPTFVTNAVVLGTFASLITLTLLISFVKEGL